MLVLVDMPNGRLVKRRVESERVRRRLCGCSGPASRAARCLDPWTPSTALRRREDLRFSPGDRRFRIHGPTGRTATWDYRYWVADTALYDHHSPQSGGTSNKIRPCSVSLLSLQHHQHVPVTFSYYCTTQWRHHSVRSSATGWRHSLLPRLHVFTINQCFIIH